MNELITVHNVKGYIDNDGTAYLSLEDVSRGLGFVDASKGETEYVRWNTVTGYLASFGFSQEVAKDTFIPENMFYRLAMKAKNETAEKFQAVVADEILPAIRKTGTYSVQSLSQIQILQQAVNILAEQERQITETKAIAIAAQSGLEQAKERITEIKDALAELPKDKWRKWVNSSLGEIGFNAGNSSYNHSDIRNVSYQLLEERAGADLGTRVRNAKKRLGDSGATKTAVNAYCKLDAVDEDKRLREIYTAIIKEMRIKHLV